MIFGSFKVDFAKVNCPAMVVSGRDDRIVAPAVAEWTARQLGTPAHILDGHAHWLLAEPGWEKIAAQVADFIDRIAPHAPLRRVA